MGKTLVDLQPYEIVDGSEGIMISPKRLVNVFKRIKGLQPGKYVVLLTLHPDKTFYSVAEMGKPEES